MAGIGRYPGGPSRAGEDGDPRATPKLERVEQMEARRGRRSRERDVRRRNKRFWSGLAVAVALAAGVGLYIGIVTHRTSEQLTDERNDLHQQQRDITSETNRVLLELWRMEDVEKQKTPP